MNEYSAKEIVEMAIQTERLGYKFYTELADSMTENPEMVKLFQTLANMEAKHEETFQRLADKLDKDSGQVQMNQWEEAQNYFRAVVESEFFMGNKSLPSLDNITTAHDAADAALKFEKETLLFFIGMRHLMHDTDAVEKIINEEARHIAWLSRFKESIKN